MAPTRRELHFEIRGPAAAPTLLFVHPNPMDASCWTFQLEHFPPRYRAVAVDLPGYGLSPPWESPFTLDDLATACWDAVDYTTPGEVGLIGCSVGAHIVMHMARLRPDRVGCLVLSGTGYHEPGVPKSFTRKRIADFETHGLGYRLPYMLENFSADFRVTWTAEWFTRTCLERGSGHLDTIIGILEALGSPDDPELQSATTVPVLIIGGSKDESHRRAEPLAAQFSDAEVVTIDGAGHACHVEQPWTYDSHLFDFFDRRWRSHGR